MKRKTIDLITVFIAIQILFYLAGSFIGADFNISKWDITLRGVVVFFSLVVGFTTCAAIIENNN